MRTSASGVEASPQVFEAGSYQFMLLMGTETLQFEFLVSPPIANTMPDRQICDKRISNLVVILE